MLLFFTWVSPWPGLQGFAYGSGAEVVTNQLPFYLFYIWRSVKVTANRLDFPRLPASGRTGKWPLSTKPLSFQLKINSRRVVKYLH